MNCMQNALDKSDTGKGLHLDSYMFVFVLRGVLVEKLFCSFFNPLISLYIYYDQYEKIWRKNQNNFIIYSLCNLNI